MNKVQAGGLSSVVNGYFIPHGTIIVIFDLAYGCARSGSLSYPSDTVSPETGVSPGRE